MGSVPSGLASDKLAGPRLSLTVIAVLVLFATVRAFATDLTDPLNKREPARPDYAPASPGDSFALPPVERKALPPDSTGKEGRYVQSIVFRGNTAIPTGELDAVAAPYRGRLVSVAEIEELRQALTRYYVERGYINSGALLEPDSAPQTLTYRIVEGRISSIRIHGLGGLDEAYIADRLVRDGDGPANIDLLRERFQLLLGDPLIARMNARLIPGEQPGEAILDIDVVRNRPYQVTAFFNNYHTPAIGSEFVGVTGSLANLTGRGDRLDLLYQDSTEFSSGGWGGVAWSVPLNYSGTSLNLQAQRIESAVVEYPLSALNIRDTLDIYDVGLSQFLVQSLRQTLSVGVDASYRRDYTTLLGEPFSFVPSEPSGTTRATTLRLWQEYTYRLIDQVLALRSTFSFVHNNAQAIPGLPPTTSVTDSHYWYWLGQAQYARQVIDNGAQVVLRGAAQATSGNLLPLDQIPIAGVYEVRGYRENQIVSDKGVILNAEFHYPVLQEPRNGAGLWLIPFYDWGRGKNQNVAATTLSSAGLAARFNWKGIEIDVSKAWRLIHPAVLDSLHGNAQDRGINFQVICAFF
jgi:hemolysin activation/secretion protein